MHINKNLVPALSTNDKSRRPINTRYSAAPAMLKWAPHVLMLEFLRSLTYKFGLESMPFSSPLALLCFLSFLAVGGMGGEGWFRCVYYFSLFLFLSISFFSISVAHFSHFATPLQRLLFICIQLGLPTALFLSLLLSINFLFPLLLFVLPSLSSSLPLTFFLSLLLWPSTPESPEDYTESPSVLVILKFRRTKWNFASPLFPSLSSPLSLPLTPACLSP